MRLACLVLVVSFLLVLGLRPVCLAVTADEAIGVIVQAERDLGLAYAAVDAAADSGSDVALLLEKLEVAANQLSEANFSYGTGDYAGAQSSAAACIATLDGVSEEAENLRFFAERARGDRLVLYAVGSVLGLCLLFVLGFYGWRLVERLYLKRALGFKPVVGDNS